MPGYESGCGLHVEPGYELPGRRADARNAARRPARYWRWWVRLSIVLLAAAYLKLVGLDGQFYYPNREIYVRPEQLGLHYEDVTFPTRDGQTLHGWFLPARTTARGAVVHFHGNAANVSAHVALVSWLPDHGYHVLMFDYRGYGRSTGQVTRAGTIADGHAALDYLRTRPDTHGLPIFFYGQSLGGAVAIVVAADRPEVAAVVAESTFSSYRRIAAAHARRLVRSRWLARGLAAITISDGFDPLDVVHRLAPRPLLVIVAERDEICFPELGRELYEAAREPKSFWLAPRAEHLAILAECPQELMDRITQFFAQAPTR